MCFLARTTNLVVLLIKYSYICKETQFPAQVNEACCDLNVQLSSYCGYEKILQFASSSSLLAHTELNRDFPDSRNFRTFAKSVYSWNRCAPDSEGKISENVMRGMGEVGRHNLRILLIM